jgi:hypothetical protein
VTQETLWERLDRIEELCPDAGGDSGALDIMREIAAGPGGLGRLIERYAGSPCRELVSALAFLIAKRSDSPHPDNAEALLSFAERLALKADPEVLGTTLSALQRQVAFDTGVAASAPLPHALYSLLQHCLGYSGRHQSLVRSGVLGVLLAFCESGALRTAFERPQLEWVLGEVEKLSELQDDLVGADLPYVLECLRKSRP